MSLYTTDTIEAALEFLHNEGKVAEALESALTELWGEGDRCQEILRRYGFGPEEEK
jgi:hypothetical protein